MSTINPNSAFVRHTIDLPTPMAIAFDAIVRASGKSKRVYFASMVEAEVAKHSPTKGAKKR